MPGTLNALAVFLLAVLPGAIYVWSFERVVGRWGVSLADRVLRFIAASALFLALFFAPLYHFRKEFLHRKVVEQGKVRFENRLAEGDDLPWWSFALPFAYLAVPAFLGTAAGRAVQSPDPNWQKVGTVLAGRNPAPRAWDFVFSAGPAAALRLKLKDGTWLGGLFGEESYASGYPETPQDIYLERAYAMNQADGSFITSDDGAPQDLGSGLLIGWDEIQFLEFFGQGTDGEDTRP